MLMDWVLNVFQHVSNYCIAVWEVPVFRYLTIAMIAGYIIILGSKYSSELRQHYGFNNFNYIFLWIVQKSYILIFVTHGLTFVKTSGLFEDGSEKGFVGIATMFVFAGLAFFLSRLGHNLICWYLGTPLWPWNPFVNKPGFEKIVAKNQRENRKRWATEQHRKRTEGERYSDE
jgi:hypothetical protein